MVERLPPPPMRRPDFLDDFDGELDPARWIAHYLPHWTMPDRSAARYRVTTAGLELGIDADQPAWREEDGPLRVSNIQTGEFAGALGTTRGMHRHRPDGLVVRTEWPLTTPWTPSSGRVDVTIAASTELSCMTAVWLVGLEQLSPLDSGEICLCEIDGDAIGAVTAVRTGLKAHHDPRLESDMRTVAVPWNASEPLTWTAIWGGGETVIGCEGTVLRRMPQSPRYPLALMIDVFSSAPPSEGSADPAVVRRVSGWSM